MPSRDAGWRAAAREIAIVVLGVSRPFAIAWKARNIVIILVSEAGARTRPGASAYKVLPV